MGKHDVGMVAEEVGEVLSEIVSYEENGIDATGLDYSRLTPLLFEAVKELKGENDRLKDRVEALDKTTDRKSKGGSAMRWVAQSISVALLTLCLPMISHVYSQYELSWHTIDSGGGQSCGGPYTLNGTIGQPDASYSAGGKYELLGGFWAGEPFCIVNFQHYAEFAEYWLEPCDELNNWCDGADLNQLDGVNRIDLRLFVEQWLCYCPVDWPLK